jgi:sugar-specific transcriptional regulator TrmB
MFDEDRYHYDIQTLINLGLTYRQSKVFLALSQMGKASIKSLSSNSSIDRANVYRTIKQLQELKLVEMFITNPMTFEALSVNEGVLLLLERKRRAYAENEVKIKEFLRKHRQRQKVSPTDEGQFTLVPGGKVTLKKIGQLVGSSERNHDCILFCKDLESRADFFVDLFRKLLRKGLVIRIIIYLDVDKELSSKFEVFKTLKNLEIRRTVTKPGTTFSLWDGKKAFLTVTPMISQPMSEGLLIDNPALVGLIQDCFELRWRSSKAIFP